ncbi:MAG: hypothetical protein ACHQUC_00655 [Chlamydiales bacterium]
MEIYWQTALLTEEVAYSIGSTIRLVLEYEKILEEYKEKNYVIKALLKSEIGMETRNQTMSQENIKKEL